MSAEPVVSNEGLVTLDEIRSAADRLRGLLKETPLDRAHSLSRTAERRIWLKHEYLQRTGSYKVRGAYNCVAQLPEGVEVVGASAGNHAQGVALAAKMTNHRAVIYMPRSAPLPKIEATRNYGAHIEFVEGGVDESLAAAVAHAETSNAVFVPPFDDRHVIAGQGTVGLELARELPAEVKTVIVPVGGGGLISGAAVALKELRPEIRIVGVEPENAAAMKASMQAGRCVSLERIDTMADGIAVRRVCDLTLAHAQHYVDELVTVTEVSIGEAVIRLLERAKAVVEPAGAVALAAVESGKVSGADDACVVLSGGNIDPVLLSKVIDYGLNASGRYMRVRVILDDHSGLLAGLSKALADMNLNVVLIEHHKAGAHGLMFNEVEVLLTLETKDPHHHEEAIAELKRRGFTCELLRSDRV